MRTIGGIFWDAHQADKEIIAERNAAAGDAAAGNAAAPASANNQQGKS